MGKSSSSGSLGMVALFVVLSILSGLLLSIWALIAKKSGNGYIAQLIFALLFIVIIGYYICFNIYMNGTSTGADNEVLVYYICMVGTYANGLAAIIWLMALFSKSS